MKILIYGCTFVLFALISLPATAEAFSRRPHRSEVQQTHTESTLHQDDNQNLNYNENGPPRSVPELSSLITLGIGTGLLILLSVKKRLRMRDASRNRAV